MFEERHNNTILWYVHLSDTTEYTYDLILKSIKWVCLFAITDFLKATTTRFNGILIIKIIKDIIYVNNLVLIVI